jgi:hypothetical protein
MSPSRRHWANRSREGPKAVLLLHPELAIEQRETALAIPFHSSIEEGEAAHCCTEQRSGKLPLQSRFIPVSKREKRRSFS